jgi:hypothetical protein
MPVTNGEFESLLAEGLGENATDRQRSLYEAIAEMHRDYDFYVPPVYESFGTLQNDFTAEMKSLLLSAQEAGEQPETAANNIWAKLKDQFGK